MLSLLEFKSVQRAAFIALALAASSCALGGPPATIVAPDDHLIVPGERVGPFRLGMSEEDLIKLGTPTKIEPATIPKGEPVQDAPGIRYRYREQWIDAYVDRVTRRVVSINVGYNGDCAGYHTVEGVSCGSNMDNIIGAFGNPDKHRGDDFGPKLRRVTYIDLQHNPRSITCYSFDKAGGSMADHPLNDVQDIEIDEGEFGDYYANGH
jgi:hypothetical protein